MSYYPYHWCIVSECKNTSIKTPNKLWIQVPNDETMRNIWLKLAKRNPLLLSDKSRLYFCEDHFDLENDMENYIQYKLMGSVKRIRIKPQCIPSRFDCQADRKRQSTSNETHLTKRQRMFTNKEIDEDIVQKDLQSAVDVSYLQNQFDRAVQTFQVQEHKSIQVDCKARYRSKGIQAGKKYKDKITSPLKFSKSIGTSPLKISMESTIKPSTSQLNVRRTGKNYKDKITSPLKFSKSICTSPLKISMESTIKPSTSQPNVRRKLTFIEENYEITSPSSCTPSLVGSTVESSPSQEEYKKVERWNLPRTLFKIKNKPKLYIGLQKKLYFVIDLIKKHTGVSEENILLCLMKIKLNRTYSELADDFDLSVTQASNIFFSKMPRIVQVLTPFIKSFSTKSIKRNLPIAFRHKYNQVTCIIDCLEIEIQKPTKAIHQALTWSEYKKTNTIKYLISCTPDGLVNFVSNGYAGRITDVNLLEHSTFLECLQPGTYILADRGFKHVELYLSQKGFVLLRPPSVPAGMKLSKAEVKQTKQIASLRIHVERVIRRIREFRMLKLHSVINTNLIGMLDSCIKTACALINLQDALTK